MGPLSAYASQYVGDLAQCFALEKSLDRSGVQVRDKLISLDHALCALVSAPILSAKQRPHRMAALWVSLRMLESGTSAVERPCLTPVPCVSRELFCSLNIKVFKLSAELSQFLIALRNTSSVTAELLLL